MGQLDRAYVPTLVFTNLHKQRESELSLARLSRQWQEFYEKYNGLELKYGQNITDQYWQENFDQVSLLLVSVEALVRDEQLLDANDKLDQVRLILRELRRRHGWDYYLDSLTDFNEAMDQILVFLRGKNRLTDRDLATLRELFKKGQVGLTSAVAAKIDPDVYGFNQEKITATKHRVKEEQRLLAGFAATLAAADAGKIFAASLELKPNFVVLYKAFGDFQPVFNQIIEERKKNEKQNNKLD